MKILKVFSVIIVLTAVTVYFFLFRNSKELKYIPASADAVMIIDVKKLERKYIAEWLLHPAEWFKKDKKSINPFSESAVKIPDYLQIFHLKNTPYSQWYTVLELENADDFVRFLNREKFIKEKDYYHRNGVFIKIIGNKCLAGTSANAFSQTENLTDGTVKSLNANDFVKEGVAGISFISGKKMQTLSVFVNDDDIEIISSQPGNRFQPIIQDLEKNVGFMNARLDQAHVSYLDRILKTALSSRGNVQELYAGADLHEVNDTIITYGYDDDFNETQKISYQKIVQPWYIIEFKSNDAAKTYAYFTEKKWINGEHQFTALPFLPNHISVENHLLTVASPDKPHQKPAIHQPNYMFIKNSDLLISFAKFLPDAMQKMVQKTDYLFYGNAGTDYYLRIKCKKQQLPLILQ